MVQELSEEFNATSSLSVFRCLLGYAYGVTRYSPLFVCTCVFLSYSGS